MSALIGIECDGCGKQILLPLIISGEVRVRHHSLRRWVALQGWVQRGPRDYCPDCKGDSRD